MAEGKQPLTEEVRSWLVKQGYPLEMKVAEIFRDKGFSVRQSDYYQDEETGSLREIDVVAELAASSTTWGVIYRVFFTVECKHGGDKPWVVLSSPPAEALFEGHLIVQRVASPAGFRALHDISLDENVWEMSLFASGDRLAHGMTQAFTSAADITYAALLAATKSAAAKAREFDTDGQQAAGRPDHATVAFPIVVIDAPLLDCHLDPDGNMNVIEIESAVINWARRYSDSRFSWPNTFVYIVTSHAAERVIGGFADDAKALLSAWTERSESH